MAYFIFTKNKDNIEGNLYKIAETESDLNNLNILKSDYTIIQDSQENFNDVKFFKKRVKFYNDNIISYENISELFEDQINKNNTLILTGKDKLKNYINSFTNQIKYFTDNNPNHSLFNRWNDYYNQLNNLDLNSITYPLNKSLEQYFNDLNQPSLNPLQLP